MNVTTWLRIKMNLEPQQKGYCYEVKICTKQNRYCKMDPKYALSIFWDFLGHARQPYIYCKMSMKICLKRIPLFVEGEHQNMQPKK